jgi:hypothetical protein
MANLVRRLSGKVEERDSLSLAFQDYVQYFNYAGNGYMFPFTFSQTLTGDHEKPTPGDYSSLVGVTYRSNAVVFALMMVRQLHFTQARFQFQQVRNGRPGKLFGSTALTPLEVPWPNGTTRDLLGRMIQDVDLAGNCYIVRQGDQLARLRPDWVTILLGSRSNRDAWVPGDPDTEVVAYIFKPGGPAGSEDEIVFPVEMVAHWAPYLDPFANYRGMSWLTPVLREVIADQAMTSHKQKFLENGATVNMVVKYDTDNLELFERYKQLFREGHQGLQNAYKTLFVAKGADITPVGTDLQQMDFKHVQSAGETRLAAAAGVPSILVGFSEGLSGSSLNAGNYSTARRRFADGTIIPLWGGAADALSSIVSVPANAVLAIDSRDVAFMKDDEKDAAAIRQADAATIKSLIDAGYEADAIIDAVTSDDFSRLSGAHTGMTSVQLVPPNQNGNSNGNGNGSMPDGSPIALAQSGTQ